ncbi:MAG: LamG-like jellyroll fold domain-containing protein, partial [Phycisphaerae bacterium]
MTRTVVAVLTIAFCAVSAGAGETWFDALIRQKEQATGAAAELKKAVPLPDFGEGSYTFMAWVRTKGDGTIFAKTLPEGRWVAGGKSLFIRGGRVCFDVGWVGCVNGRTPVADGKWHHVAFCGAGPQKIYVDGRLDASGGLEKRQDVRASVLKLGDTSTSFPPRSAFTGEMDDVRIYGRVLSASEVQAHFEKTQPPSGGGLVACWPFDGDGLDASGCLNHANAVKGVTFTDGRAGKALRLTGAGHMVVHCGAGESAAAGLWAKLTGEFTDDASRREMSWEREDGIWGHDWQTVRYANVARRYVDAARRHSSIAEAAAALAANVAGPADLKKVRRLYVDSRRRAQLLERFSQYRLKDLRGDINDLYRDSATGPRLLARLDALEAQAARWEGGPPEGDQLEKWSKAVEQLRRDVTVNNNPLIDFDKIVFVKRYTYSANHYYTEYINSTWTPGGDLCVLDLKDGSVRQIVPSLKGGVFERFDLSFDARRIVFAWKPAWQEGYRIYEVNVDGTGLRQLTFPQENEKWLVEMYRARPHYHHGTDDMHPCYLPDGDICFISTRCQYGILCDAPDDFTTTVLYRMDPDGKNMRKLTNSSVSEASPVM